MQTINLKKYYYPDYKTDTFLEVSDEGAEALLIAHRYEKSSHKKMVYHKAFYSLDCGDGIEDDCPDWAQPSPEVSADYDGIL